MSGDQSDQSGQKTKGQKFITVDQFLENQRMRDLMEGRGNKRNSPISRAPSTSKTTGGKTREY